MNTKFETKTNIDYMDEFLTELFLPIEEDENEDECENVEDDFTDEQLGWINFYLSITEEQPEVVLI